MASFATQVGNRTMALFQPSTDLTRMVLEVSPPFSSEMRFRKEMSGSASFRLPDTARKVLGEQVVGRIAMLGRHIAVDEPGNIIQLAEVDDGELDGRFR